jgi:hypothetical protein
VTMTRAKHEASINRFRTTFGRELSNAITVIINRRGLDFFTTEQLAEIRAEIVGHEWSRRCINQENRNRRAA